MLESGDNPELCRNGKSQNANESDTANVIKAPEQEKYLTSKVFLTPPGAEIFNFERSS